MLQTETENSIAILPNSDYYSAKNRPKSSFNVILDSRNEHLPITILNLLGIRTCLVLFWVGAITCKFLQKRFSYIILKWNGLYSNGVIINSKLARWRFWMILAISMGPDSELRFWREWILAKMPSILKLNLLSDQSISRSI